MELVWIRHGETKGNRNRKYIGRTDEPLSLTGRNSLLKNLQSGRYPNVGYVYMSPMKRCVETAEILYPNIRKEIVADFRECDFGLFENKNYEELKEVPQYKEWMKSKGTGDFPGGERVREFKDRCVKAFMGLPIHDFSEERIAFVVHGGTIMAVMEALEREKKAFYDYSVKNGGGYICEIDCNDSGRILHRLSSW